MQIVQNRLNYHLDNKVYKNVSPKSKIKHFVFLNLWAPSLSNICIRLKQKPLEIGERGSLEISNRVKNKKMQV